MKKRTSRVILCLISAFLIALTVLPASALAEGVEAQEPEQNENKEINEQPELPETEQPVEEPCEEPGTLYLNNMNSNGIKGNDLTIDGGSLNVKGGQAAINMAKSLTTAKGMTVKGSKTTGNKLENDGVSEYVTIKAEAVKPSDKKIVPKTHDGAHPWVWAFIGGLALGASAVILVVSKKRQR